MTDSGCVATFGWRSAVQAEHPNSSRASWRSQWRRTFKDILSIQVLISDILRQVYSPGDFKRALR